MGARGRIRNGGSFFAEKEEESMRSLIAAAEEHNILFIFALSPGSDVVYSQEEDVNFLKSKLQQVGSFTISLSVCLPFLIAKLRGLKCHC
ncbi:unnamed protein product [Dibothriocephalus latus]|uniref:GH84 domain-containing protein n=1 Tax=Dibothriocephalus latus TaxID=60516 RepID=A0A3P6TDD6_DIBLA|nr:unnamed protein product [Dibothriocephalus latus]